MQAPRDRALQVTRLLAAGTRFSPRARSELAALASSGQADALGQILAEQRLTELLGSRAVDLAKDSLPSSFVESIDRAVAGSRARAMALEALALQVTQKLEAEGIPTLPLKGPFLARRLYGDVGMRFVNDLDILVSPDNVHEASALIQQLGYAPHDPPWLEGLPPLHYTLRDPSGRLPRIELHWRIHWYEEEFSEALLARSEPGNAGLREARIDDELAALLLYYARDGFYGLRAAADIASWWKLFGNAADSRPVLAGHWAEHPPLRGAFAGAALAADAIVGVPAASVLPAASLDGIRTRLAVRLACWSQEGEHDQLLANLRVVDGLLSPPGGMPAFLRRFVVLDRREIATMYDSESTAVIWMWQLWHVAKVTARYMLGLAGALLPRRRRTLPESPS